MVTTYDLTAVFQLDEHATLLEFDSPCVDLRVYWDLGLARWEDPETGATLGVLEVAEA